MEEYTITKDQLEGFVKRFLSTLKKYDAQACVIGLSGNLGAGKTTFTQTLARELGVIGPITSPTFVIEKRYDIQSDEAPFDTLIHIDAYRLEQGGELESLGFARDLENPNSLIVIEWPERVEDILPEARQTLTFTVVDEATRSLRIHNGKNNNEE